MTNPTTEQPDAEVDRLPDSLMWLVHASRRALANGCCPTCAHLQENPHHARNP